jgi:flagellar biosynthesis/type III secretory pathway M-ring protein FliF/YscJ
MVASLGALWSAPALGYIGPGAGITVLGALWGVLVAIVLAIGAVLFWPVRILFRRRRNRSAESADETSAEASDAEMKTAEPSGTSAGEQST